MLTRCIQQFKEEFTTAMLPYIISGME